MLFFWRDGVRNYIIVYGKNKKKKNWVMLVLIDKIKKD